MSLYKDHLWGGGVYKLDNVKVKNLLYVQLLLKQEALISLVKWLQSEPYDW